MKRFNFKNIRFKKVNVKELDQRVLLINLYATQAATLFIGLIIIMIQKQDILKLMVMPHASSAYLLGLIFAGLVLALDWLVARWVPEDVTDDGGVNEMIFRTRPLWHIIILCLVVSICEEVLFRGAIQHGIGPYWTSILFAAIHVRYLQHWVMTGLVFSISYGLGWIYLQTGSLWTVIVAHFVINLVMGCILRYRRES